MIQHALSISLKSGEGWFRRFKTENPDVIFLRKGQEDKYKNETLTIRQWAADNERFITDKNGGNLCSSPQSIFVVESDKLVWKGVHEMTFTVVVSIKSHFLTNIRLMKRSRHMYVL